MKCPICENKLTKHLIDTNGGSILLEEEKECKDCSYQYSYAYGYSRTSVGNVCVEESYKDSKEVSEMKSEIIKIAIQILKEELK